MCNLVNFPRHKPVRCKPTCSGCCLCDGGLIMCERCGGSEAELPTDCPGVEMTYHQREHVQAGALNYTFKYGWAELACGERRARPFGEKRNG